MALFSKQRGSSIPNQSNGNLFKLKRYVLYAVGEIVLVVIGILIAVSINNWNENQKEKERLTSYLKDYRNDLIIDSTSIHKNLEILKLKKGAFDLVLSDSLNLENLNKTPIVYSLLLTYSPIRLQTKGFSELKNYAANNEAESDTLVQRIIAEHSTYSDLINTMMERVSNDVDDNMTYFKNNKPWIGDLLRGKLTDDIKAYFVSEDFRNRAAIHYTLEYNNVEALLKTYQNTHVKQTLNSIDSRLQSEH